MKTAGWSGTWTLLILVAGCAGPLEPSAAEDPFPARTFARDKPVIMVHGFDFFGEESSNPADWQPLKTTLLQTGWNQPLQTWGYYGCDVGFDLHASDHGSHDAYSTPASHVSNECSPTAHSRDTPIEHLAYHWAWTVYDLHGSAGQCVDVVAHSMGGLIVRYALGQVQASNPAFPNPFCVEDVVTLGTPHGGSELAGLFSVFCPSAQCNSMLPGSPFLQELEATAQSPGGFGGTDWTLVGSQSDFVVSVASALGMAAAHHAFYFEWSGISHANHPNYLADFGSTASAAIRYRDGNQDWRVSSQSPWPLAWIDQSLVYDKTDWVAGIVAPAPTTSVVFPTTLAGGVVPGQSVEFEAACSDEDEDLIGAVWYTSTANGLAELATDTVQFHDDPWLTYQAVEFPNSGQYTIRVECMNQWLGTSFVEWTITADSSFKAEPIATRINPPAASAQTVAGETGMFEAACANPDGMLDRAEWFSRSAGGSWVETSTDNVQVSADPWTTSQSYLFDYPGTFEIRVRCVDSTGDHSEAIWTVQVAAGEESQPDQSAPPETGRDGALRVEPSSSSVTIAPGASLDFEVACEDAYQDLDHAEWWTRSPGGNWILDDTDGVQFHANPWYSSAGYTFSSVGSYGIRATCVKEDGTSDRVDWAISVQ